MGDTTTAQLKLILRRFEDTFPAWMIAVPIGAVALLFLVVMLQRRSHAHQSFLRRLVAVFSPPWPVLLLVAGCGAFAFLGYLLISLASWWLILVPVLAVGLAYVGIMYFRDSGSVGAGWAAFLGVLRTVVYLILACFFLLPAWQHSTKTERRSKVVVLFDVSASMAEVDDVAEDGNVKLLKRREKVLKFLGDDKIAFIDGLLKTNPVTCYRFGKTLDPRTLTILSAADGITSGRWGTDDPKDPPREWTAADLKKELESWLCIDPNRKGIDVKQAKLESDLYLGTNLGSAVRQVLAAEEKNMLQGIVIFSDGQSNQEEDMPGSMAGEHVYDDLREQVKRAKIPLLCVGVGKFKPNFSIRVGDIEAPTTARSDEPFPVNVPVIARGLKDKEYEVVLEFTRTRDNDDRPVTEASHQLTLKSRHKEGEPDRVEFQIDVMALKKMDPAKVKQLSEKERAAIMATIEGTWEFKARVARDKREAFANAFHTPEQPARVKIFQKKLRVLLFAGGPSKEYQFVRTLLDREVQANRMELGVFLQTNLEEEIDLGKKDQDWVLNHFPIHRVRSKPEEMPYTLFEYDVIVALDPDWYALTKETLLLVKEWVQEKAGGLIFAAGPVNTYQLRELGAGTEADDLTPIRDLVPCFLKDSRTEGLGEGFDPTARFPLAFQGPLAQFDFLKLDEDGKGPIAGWNEFFFGETDPKPNAELENGFYSYYPVSRAKSIAQVLATFPTQGGAGAGLAAQPYIAVAPSGQGSVIYLGSLEWWRLRNYKAIFHQHFWVKLVRYAGATNMGRVQKFGLTNIPERMLTGDKNRVEYQLRGPDGKLLGREDAERFKLQVVLMPFKKVDDPEPDPDPTSWSIFQLKGKPGNKNEKTGWFMAEFPIEQPGKYQVRLAHGARWFQNKIKPDEKNEVKMKIPGTEEELINTVLVTQPNPELDNLKPDLVRLYGLASDKDMVVPRIPKELEEYKQKVDQLKGPLEEGAPTRPRDGRRLYFDLDSAGIIPFLMIPGREAKEIKGNTKDLRDEGFDTGLEDVPPWLLGLILVVLAGWFANILILQWEFKASEAFSSNWLFRFVMYLLVPFVTPFLVVAIVWVAQRFTETPKPFRYLRVFLLMLAVNAVEAALILTILLSPVHDIQLFDEPVRLAWVMAFIVFFLSVEWLSRKLLRLA
jgi:hypothetical protein